MPQPSSLTPVDLRDLAYNFQSSRIFFTAYELGIFTVLDERAKTSKAVARALKTNPRATDRLLNALCAMDLLEKKNGMFANTSLVSEYLVQGKPEYMAGFMHTVSLWKTWSTLTEAVRKGTSVAMRPEVNARGSKWLTEFIAAMHERALKQAPAIVAGLNLSGISRVLDVGGGSGAFAMAFVRARKNITATVFDVSKVIPLTRRYVRREKLSRKINFVVGDYLISDLGKGYDLVFLSAIVHSNSLRENRLLIRKCAKALNQNGQVVVQDFIMDEDRTSPAHGAFFALNMLVGTKSGDTYTESEVYSWMKSAGLSPITTKSTQFGVTQIIGWKR